MRGAELATVVPLPRAKGAVREGFRYVRDSPDLLFVFVVAFFAGTFGLNFQMTSALMATGVSTRAPGSTASSVPSWRSARWRGRCSRPGGGYPRRALLVMSALSFALSEVVAGMHADVPDLRRLAAGARDHLAHDAELPADGRAAVGRPGGARVGWSRLYMMTLMGGTPVGCAHHRLGRSDVRRALDADRRRPRHRHRRRRRHGLADPQAGHRLCTSCL